LIRIIEPEKEKKKNRGLIQFENRD